jgi:CTP:molybdopterin cytidylyltransferase MocA
MEVRMTVAAVVLAASPASALGDADGTPGIRRIADTAWAGGATPVVVCSFDPDGGVAAALANAEIALVEPVDRERGPVGQIVNGIEAARRLVAETDAVLLWPARLAWVDAETVTQLIETHGLDRHAVIRPTYRGEAGFPALLPVEHLARIAALGAGRMPGELLDDLEAAGVPFAILETGDPGTTHDLSVARADLPPFDGPPIPVDAHEHEWGAAEADLVDEEPPTGPAPVRVPQP